MITKEQYSDVVIKVLAFLCDVPMSLKLKFLSLAFVPGMIWAFERELHGMVAYLWVLGMAVFLVSRSLEGKP